MKKSIAFFKYRLKKPLVEGERFDAYNPNTGTAVFPKETAVWKYSQAQTELFQADNRLFWGVDGTAKMPRIKKFLFEHDGVVNRTFWHYEDVNHTQGASNQLKNLNIIGFSTPIK